jgi:hypothetical protein
VVEMWCSVATRHTVSAVTWWETALIALLASLTGAFFGASSAALFAARQRRRAARADILTRHLPPLLDRVADAANAVKDTREPQPQSDEIWAAYQTLEYFALAASREDYERVHYPMGSRLRRIDETNAEYAATSNASNRERAAAARQTSASQLKEWRALGRLVVAYRDWLAKDLGRWW